MPFCLSAFLPSCPPALAPTADSRQPRAESRQFTNHMLVMHQNPAWVTLLNGEYRIRMHPEAMPPRTSFTAHLKTRPFPGLLTRSRL
jgi:hypothetical protein